MALFDNQIMALFSMDLFRQIAANEQVSIYKFNMFTSLLINNGIPYDVSYASGTRKEAPALQLTIHINPTTTLVFAIALAPGSTSFTPSP